MADQTPDPKTVLADAIATEVTNRQAKLLQAIVDSLSNINMQVSQNAAMLALLQKSGGKTATRPSRASGASGGSSSAGVTYNPERVSNTLLYFRYMFGTDEAFRAKWLVVDPRSGKTQEELDSRVNAPEVVAKPAGDERNNTIQKFIWKEFLSEAAKKDLKTEYSSWKTRNAAKSAPAQLSSEDPSAAPLSVSEPAATESPMVTQESLNNLLSGVAPF